ncbi:MAG: AMP-binding protein [Clostridia bacterium]|nr:AMP-binding protein [Clostridia bacterium]
MEMIEKTLGGVLDGLAANYPDSVAIKYTTRDYQKTWSELNERCNAVAKGLLSLGVKKDDKVAIWATNVPEWYEILFGSAKVGAILVTVNTNYKEFELEYLLKQSDTKILVMIDGVKNNSYVDTIDKLLPEFRNSKNGDVNNEKFPFLKKIVYCGDKNSTPRGFMSFEDIVKAGENVTDEELAERMNSLNCHEVINMQYTSGTTGFPKGVMLTHYNVINNGKSIGDCMKFTDKDKLLITVPMFHCFGLVLGLMSCITHATTMVPVESFSPTKVMNAITVEKCTAVHGVPTMFIAMLEHPDFEKYNFSSLRTGIMAGSPCPIKVMRQAVDQMNLKEITIVFGQTEASPGCTQTTTDDSLELRVNTVGRVLAGVEAKIVDPATGEEVPCGVAGEFCARGYNIMKGYYKMPEATAEAIDKDGWLHTGDLCTVDKDGYYKVVGRIKDMIIRGGENIYPKEIEEFYYTQPIVKDVQVIGVPSEQYGEEVMAVIILKEGESATPEELRDLAKANLAKHKVPKYIRIVDAFPVTASGKIQKFKMREEAIELLKLQSAAEIETA